MVIAAITILYGNLCALPQRNLKRLMGYSGISHAGYMLMGIAALSATGQAAVLYYLAGYLFTVVAAFTVVALVMRHLADEDIGALAGLNQRSPLLATTMTVAVVSLGGIPPLAGFFGKFLLFRAVIEQGPANSSYYWLAAVAIAGVIISLYYYFGVIRAIYWSKDPADLSPIKVAWPTRLSLGVCIVGMFYFCVFPDGLLTAADGAVKFFKL